MRYSIVAGSFFAALLFTLSLGCGNRADREKKPKPQDKEDLGLLFGEPNEKHHVWLKIDQAGKKATAKIAGSEPKETEAIAASSITLFLKDSKESIVLESQGKKGEKSAVFAGTHEKLGAKLDPDQMEIRAEIDGKNIHFKREKDHGH